MIPPEGGAGTRRVVSANPPAGTMDPTWNRVDPDGSIRWAWGADFVGFRVVRAVEEQDGLKRLLSQVR
jgi:hypothetical protein